MVLLGLRLSATKWLSAMLVVVAIPDSVIARTFDGAFEFRWLPDPDSSHREMRLLSDVAFTDESGRLWEVPAGTNIDGASIPRIFWTFEGSPFVGNYRRASVVHDYFCTLTVATPSDVHWMFYEAMLADGVGWLEARRKHAAVSVYSWAGGSCADGVPSMADLDSLPPPETFQRTEELLAFAQRYDVMTLDLGDLRIAVDEIKAIARVEKSQTFDALVEFRLSPTEENYTALEQAIERENTTPEQIKELSALARAATGGGGAPPGPIRQ